MEAVAAAVTLSPGATWSEGPELQFPVFASRGGGTNSLGCGSRGTSVRPENAGWSGENLIARNVAYGKFSTPGGFHSATSPRKGLRYSQTTFPSGVTSKTRPCVPAQ